MKNHVYLDHNATTPLLPQVKEALMELLDQGWGNPSSIHWAGRKPKELIRISRQEVAQALGCSLLDLVFTSSATESNTTVIQLARYLLKHHPQWRGRRRIISSNIEHPSISQSLQVLADRGEIEWIRVPVRISGGWDWDFFREHLNEQTLLVTVMAANNETGIILPVAAIAEEAKKVGALVHSDITQAFLKEPIDLKNCDYASFSGHKIYALKGVGVLYVNKHAPWESLFYGGGQERFRRAGTENTLAIASLGLAIKALREHYPVWLDQLSQMRDYLEAQVTDRIPEVAVTHQKEPRLPHTSHFRFKGIDSETLLMKLDLEGFAVSAGSACSSGSSEPSPTLLAMGLAPQEAQSSLRISLGVTNTRSEIDRFIETLERSVRHLRQVREVTL